MKFPLFKVDAVGAKLAKNIFSLGVVQAVMIALPLVTLPYLLRVLGPAAFGGVVFAQAVIGYIVLIVDYGFNLSAVKRVSELRGDKDGLSELFAAIQGAKIFLALLSLTVLTVVVLVVPALSRTATLIVCAGPLILNCILFPQWLFQGLERMGLVAVCVAASRFLAIPLTFLLVHDTGDAWKAVLVASSTPLVGGVMAHVLIIRNRLVGWRPVRWTAIRDAMVDGWSVFLAGAGASLYSTTNNVALGLVCGQTTLGFFAAADKIRQAFQAFIPPVANAFYPHIVGTLVDAPERGFRAAGYLLMVLGGIGTLVSVALFFSAPLLVEFVMGGGYTEAVVVLRYLSPLPLLLSLNTVLGVNVLLPAGMKRAFSATLLGAGLVNVMLLIPLAYKFGAAGAAVSLVITESLVVATMACFVARKRIQLF